MKIRKEQMEAFAESRKEDFVQRMVQHLSNDFVYECDKQGIDEADIDPLVRRGIEEAKGYDVVYEEDVELYLECMVLLGPGFDRKAPWAREVFRSDQMDGSAKMAEIEQYLLFGGEEPR